MPKRILLADDSITIQKVVELTFSDGDYEVTAVNNGAKAIAKLAEMRPDVILSDIIMPEKNGYEVCEYVKSHPEYRTIPVVLLTGTFEPFDPDRADKAGCDAVVTKPFESQSLIHKVEELIDQSRATATTAPQPAMPEAEQLTTGVFNPAHDEAPEFQEHGSDIFAAAPPPSAPPEPEIEASPWDEPPSTGGETRAFPSMSFEELQRMANEAPTPAAAPPPPSPPTPTMEIEPSPWDEPAEAPTSGGETRAFPMMSFDDLQRMPTAAPPPPPPAPVPEPEPEASPWDEAPVAELSSGGETRAFPSMSFEDLQRMTSEPAPQPFDTTPPPEPPPPDAASPWEQAEEFGGETRAFSRMSFDELEKMATSGTTPMPAPEPEPEPEPVAAASVAAPVAAPEPEPEPEAPPESFAQEAPPEPEPEISLPPIEVTESVAAVAVAGDLSDEQIDRIARRVVQLMSDQVVRNIAWEVIPDLAEMVVKERIRELESEG